MKHALMPIESKEPTLTAWLAERENYQLLHLSKALSRFAFLVVRHRQVQLDNGEQLSATDASIVRISDSMERLRLQMRVRRMKAGRKEEEVQVCLRMELSILSKSVVKSSI